MGSDAVHERAQELRSLIGFTDDDSARLRAAWPALQASTPSIVERLFEAALANDAAHRAIAGPAQVARAKQALARWLHDLGQGPHDDAYYQRQVDLAGALVDTHLPARLLVAAMMLVKQELHGAVRRTAVREDVDLLAQATARLCDVVLAIMMPAYLDAREQRGLADLREVIVSHLPSGVILLDADDRVTTSTLASPRVFSHQHPGGKPWREVLQPALVDAADLAHRIERARRLRREILMPRLDVALASGTACFRITVTPLSHPMAEVLLHIEDLTDTLASEARATRAEQLAKLASMASTVAHEIRNPLAGVSAAVQVVASTLPHDDPRRAALIKVQEQVQRLGNLVGDLLSLSKPIAMTPRDVDLAALAASVASSEHGVAEVTGLGSASADEALLTQVLFNLVQNAWQAGARAVRINVDGTRLCVLDDGPGIPRELQDKVFEPFFTTKTRGTGLGLPTARKIVEAMGGTLRLCASPLGGCGFEVQLQQQDPHATHDE